MPSLDPDSVPTAPYPDAAVGGGAGTAGTATDPGGTAEATDAAGTAEPTSPAAARGRLQLGGDIPAARLGFGTMRLTGPGILGEPADREQAIAALRRAVELGVDFVDTADSYGPGVSEDLVREALHPYAGVTVATKGGLTRPGPDEWEPRGDPAYLRECVEGSLRRLGLDRIDLYQLHRIDPGVPVADQLGALRELQAEGKIRHLGLCAVTVEQIERARNFVTVVSVQNPYSVALHPHDSVVDYCRDEGLVFIPYGPLAQGSVATEPGDLVEMARRYDATPAQIALAWLLHRSPVSLPIPGTSSVAHLEENVAAASISLRQSDVEALTALG